MEGKKSINTDINTPIGKYHVQTEFYKTSNKIITLIFTQGRTIARLEHIPTSSDINTEITSIHEKICKKLSLLKEAISQTRLIEILTLSTGLKKVFFFEELLDKCQNDTFLKNLGILIATGVNVPEGMAFLKDAPLEEIEKGVELLKKKISNNTGFVIKTTSDEQRITLFITTKDNLIRKIVELRESSASNIIVLKMIKAKVSGVAFSSDPISREKSVIIEAGWGLWGYLKGSKLNLDRFRVDREGLDFWRIKKHVANKVSEISIDLESGNISENALSDERAYQPSLTDSEILSIAKKMFLIEDAFEKIVKVNFLVDEKENIYFLDATPISIKEKKELFRNLTIVEDFQYFPTGIKLLAEINDIDTAKSVNFIPADGFLIKINNISEKILETILAEKAERFFPQPIIIDLTLEPLIKIISKIRKRGFLNIWILDRGNFTIPPDIPSFKLKETPIIKGEVFEGDYGKLFVSDDTILAANIPFIRELIKSGFDYISVHPDELIPLRKFILSEERRLLVEMARKFLNLPKRL